MGQSLSKILVHIIFSTKERRPWLSDQIANELYRYIIGTLKQYDCETKIIGGIEDHIHILCSLSKNHASNKIIEKIKTSSSKWIKTKGEKYQDFYWQNGYGIFSVSSIHEDIIYNYIFNQKEHHKKITFKEELQKMLNKYVNVHMVTKK